MGIPRVGERVRWASQSGGVWLQKEGECIYSGAKPGLGMLPDEVLSASDSRIKFDVGRDGRYGSGIIIKVARVSGAGFDYYSPRITSRLEVIE